MLMYFTEFQNHNLISEAKTSYKNVTYKDRMVGLIAATELV